MKAGARPGSAAFSAVKPSSAGSSPQKVSPAEQRKTVQGSPGSPLGARASAAGWQTVAKPSAPKSEPKAASYRANSPSVSQRSSAAITPASEKRSTEPSSGSGWARAVVRKDEPADGGKLQGMLKDFEKDYDAIKFKAPKEVRRLDRVGEVCGKCNDSLILGDVIYQALGKSWHQQCFICVNCKTNIILPTEYFSTNGMPLCGSCRTSLKSCMLCKKDVGESGFLMIPGKGSLHAQCAEYLRSLNAAADAAKK